MIIGMTVVSALTKVPDLIPFAAFHHFMIAGLTIAIILFCESTTPTVLDEIWCA